MSTSRTPARSLARLAGRQPAYYEHARSFAQALLQACWSVTPGPLARPQSAG